MNLSPSSISPFVMVGGVFIFVEPEHESSKSNKQQSHKPQIRSDRQEDIHKPQTYNEHFNRSPPIPIPKINRLSENPYTGNG